MGGEGVDYMQDLMIRYLYIDFKAKSHLPQMCVYLHMCVHMSVCVNLIIYIIVIAICLGLAILKFS